MVAYRSGGASEASKVGGRCRPGTPLLMLIPSPHSGNPSPPHHHDNRPRYSELLRVPSPPLPPWYSGVFLTLINCLLGILALHHGTPTLHHRLTPHSLITSSANYTNGFSQKHRATALTARCTSTTITTAHGSNSSCPCPTVTGCNSCPSTAHGSNPTRRTFAKRTCASEKKLPKAKSSGSAGRFTNYVTATVLTPITMSTTVALQNMKQVTLLE